MDRINESNREQGNAIRFGTIAEVDAGAARCRVQSGDVLSDWVPWFVPRAGETIEWSAPSVGEQCMLLSPEGDTTGAVALRGIYSSQFPAPSGEASSHLVRYPDGAEVEYDSGAHALYARLPDGGTAEITADGGVTINADGGTTINGPLTVNGNTQINGDAGINGTATADVDAVGGGVSLKSHIHTGVTTGGGTSGPPQ